MFRTHAHRSMDMTEGPLMSKVLFFSLPIMLSGLLQLVFNAADTIVVGRFAGNQALAAVGSVGSLNNLLISLFIGLSVGVNVVVARYTGARDFIKVRKAVHTSVLLSIVSGVGLSLLGYFAAYPLLRLMGSPEDVIVLAALYVRILFIGMPVQLLYNFCAAILRAIGDTKRPLYFLSFAGVINVVLNLIFVILFHMSVAGVALATIISQAISAVLVVHCLVSMEGPTHLNLRKLRLDMDLFMEIVRIGLPAGIQSSMFSLSNVVIQSSVNSFGSIVIAGNAAAANVGNFVYQVMNTFQQSITCFAGQNIGARKPMRVMTAMKVCIIWAVVFGVIFGVTSCIFGTQLLSMYSTDAAVIEVGLERMYIMHLTYFLCGIMDVLTGALRGIGYSVLPMVVSLMGACVFRIFWVMTIFAAFPTMACLIASYPVSWLLTALVLLIFFNLIWKRRFCVEFTPEELAQR